MIRRIFKIAKGTAKLALIVLCCVLFSLFAACGSCFVGCAPYQNAHVIARSSVVSLAGATRIVHSVCAETLTAAAQHADTLTPEQLRQALALGQKCERIFPLATALEVAAANIDRFETRDPAAVACAVGKSSRELLALVGELRAAGAEVPLVIDQAIAVASAASEVCP